MAVSVTFGKVWIWEGSGWAREQVQFIRGEVRGMEACAGWDGVWQGAGGRGG